MSQRFGWLLESPPVTPPAPAGGTAETLAQNPIDAFLGFGIIRPFQRDEKNDFANDGGVALVKSCIGQILGTRSSSQIMQGEIPWRPEFGSKFALLVHRKGPNSRQVAKAYAQEAISRWEPRVRIVDAVPEFDQNTRTMKVRISFQLITENVPSNQVRLTHEVTVPVAA